MRLDEIMGFGKRRKVDDATVEPGAAFDKAWKAAADRGRVDEIGGAEYRRAARDFIGSAHGLKPTAFVARFSGHTKES